MGQTQRGYERFMEELRALLRGDAEVVLLKGAGTCTSDEWVVRHLSRTGILDRVCGRRLRFRRYQLEFASFALSCWSRVRRGGFDVVHVIDPPLCRWMHWLRRLDRGRYRLLFTDAGPEGLGGYRWVDHWHCLTPRDRDEALARGLRADRVTMLPVGTDPRRFVRSAGREELRRRHGIGENTFVILAVSAINRHHKRLDHLIGEVAKLEGDVLLWIDGSLHPDGDPSLVDLARRRLGDRCRISHVLTEQLGDLYGLADVFVAAALDERFGMALVEAMCRGVPAVAHDSPHFRWLLGGNGHLVNMATSGELAGALKALREDDEALRSVVSPGDVAARFAWSSLKSGYLEMYERVAASTMGEVARACPTA